MKNNSPWLWNANQTAAGMTARTSNGIRILQGRRAPGTFTPSEKTINAHAAAAIIWPWFRKAIGFVRTMFTNVPTGRSAANEFYKRFYEYGISSHTSPTPAVVEAGILYSQGLMTPTPITNVVADESTNFLTFDYEPLPADATQLATDESWLVVRNLNNENTISTSTGVRSDGASGNLSMAPLDVSVGHILAIYHNFRGADETLNEGTTSNSYYITTTVVV